MYVFFTLLVLPFLIILLLGAVALIVAMFGVARVLSRTRERVFFDENPPAETKTKGDDTS
jgi:hypothetical protein